MGGSCNKLKNEKNNHSYDQKKTYMPNPSFPIPVSGRTSNLSASKAAIPILQQPQLNILSMNGETQAKNPQKNVGEMPSIF